MDTTHALRHALALPLVALAVSGCAGNGSAQPALPTTCPSAEPVNAGDCAVPVDRVCRYVIATERPDFCRCDNNAWQCGVPLGIDALSDAPGCPASHPVGGSACTPPPPQPALGSFRLGCHYRVAATPDTHDCVCAHFANGQARWDCARSGGGMPVTDQQGCPARQPVESSLCAQPPSERTDCQYGYNLSTTCRCAPIAGRAGTRAWRCETHAQPPSPGPPAR